MTPIPVPSFRSQPFPTCRIRRVVLASEWGNQRGLIRVRPSPVLVERGNVGARAESEASARGLHRILSSRMSFCDAQLPFFL